ncbi:MAG: hypothetical protein Q9174_005854, partial [Haloplaca sp. 1 TL-2023]
TIKDYKDLLRSKDVALAKNEVQENHLRGLVSKAEAQDLDIARLEKRLAGAHQTISKMETADREKEQHYQKTLERCNDLIDRHDHLLDQYSISVQAQWRDAGGIWVIARVRPLRDDEDASLSAGITVETSTCDTVRIPRRENRTPGQSPLPVASHEHYRLRRAFSQFESNKTIIDDLSPLFHHIIDTEHTYIVVDGQSGSGKSYTMLTGPNAIATVAAERIFADERWEADAWETRITCSAVEVYLDNAVDLLLLPGNQISQDKEPLGRGRSALRFAAIPVISVEQALSLFKSISKKRRSRSTGKNASSSRGHLVCALTKTLRSTTGSQPDRTTKLALVDLAGSERFDNDAVESCQDETTFINKSRWAIREDLRQWTGKEPRPSSRPDQLPGILREFLQDECKVLYFAHVSPLLTDAVITQQTLEYAQQ